ncbi:hypothetical protein QJS10_CPB18g01915 [Acorus calamus]|uniref:Uncharacterized protein n=1 Tax=Acorus calamus TaxID=4465 RepID=A0AAV9CQR1_ACOCL|nr:hypothetical protein QJS10_CPB18g01915 [Acorus calamus]
MRFLLLLVLLFLLDLGSFGYGYATGPRGGRHQRRTPNAAPPNAFIPWRNEGNN